ncbi:DUF2628 domain-containing protein [Thermodesulfobacteriota bacterium]
MPNNADKNVIENGFINFKINNPLKYLKQFKKFNVDGADTFKITWNWAAFIFGFLWFLYRKLYYWAFIVFISGIAFLYIGSRMFYVILFFLTNDQMGSSEWGVYCALITIKAVWGITGNYIYYKHLKKKFVDAKKKQQSRPSRALNKIGGVNKWVITCSVTLLFIGFIAAIFLPAFSGYQFREGNSKAQSCLRDAVTAQETYYVDNSIYTDSIEDLVGSMYGLIIKEGITVEIISGDKYGYTIVAFHKDGDKKYLIKGPGGTMESSHMKRG